MGRNIFVSYKYADVNVPALPGQCYSTVRNYVDEFDKLLSAEDHIYKGEDNDADLSHLSEDAIAGRLASRIYDSTLTIVVISKGMNNGLSEKQQWIPWEISYSLKEISRGGRVSQTNAMLAVVLPDQYGSSDYYITYNAQCNSINYNTEFLFPILKNNMFNQKNANTSHCNGNTIFYGYSSYIYSVKWDDFKNNINNYLGIAYMIHENRNDYEIVKMLE